MHVYHSTVFRVVLRLPGCLQPTCRAGLNYSSRQPLLREPEEGTPATGGHTTAGIEETEVWKSSTVPFKQHDELSHDIPFNANEDCNVPQALQVVNPSVKDGSFYAENETLKVQNQYLCMDCGKSFTRKSSLVVHQRTHTGEKLFMCTECGNSFGLKSSLVRHIRIHSPKIHLQHKKVCRRKKPHKCPQCEKSFSRPSRLAAHERTHKKEMFYPKSEPKKSDCLYKENIKDAKGNTYQFRIQNSIFHPVTESGGNCSTSAQVHKDDTETLKQELPDVTEELNQSIDKKSYIAMRYEDDTTWKSSNEAKNMCMDCGKSFTRKASLIVHHRTHTGEKLFMCIDCGTRFSLKSSLVRHMRSHCPKKLNICSDCGKCFSDYSSLFQHQKVHRKDKSHKCPHCEKSFSRASQLLFHRKTHKLEKSCLPQSEPGDNTDELGKPNCYVNDSCAEEPHVCLESGIHSMEQHHQKSRRSASRASSYTNPDYNADAGKPLPEINSKKHKSEDIICNVESTDPEPVEVVKRECANSNSICKPRLSSLRSPYHCIQCGKNFTRKLSLTAHQKIHSEEKLFICTECGKRFCFKSCLVRHQKSHTGPMLNICSECGIYFSRYCDLTLHLENHMESKGEPCKNNLQHSLNEDKDGVTVALMEGKESSLIQKDQQCCERGSFSNDYVDSQGSQRIKQETSENHFADDGLSKSQKNEDECTDPYGLYLNNELNISESVTEGSTRKSDETNKHSVHPILNVLGIHDLEGDIWDGSDELQKQTQSREKCFYCLECGKNFTRNSSLIVHQRTHTGEKLFMCTECGKRFGLKSSLVRHMRTHNTENFKCVTCGKSFRDYSKFLKHQTNRHSGELPITKS
ncbi:uncharacterized protein [Phyllobates terribilis]|uniref:uncharacterized protein isoform X2 n=1 Tax=Phyllobates terribilis TaxID=111132 RepID=UPI003CCB4438